MDYQDFLNRKTHVGADHGFDPTFMPDLLFPFQVSLVEWATRKGRAAIFADCGLGKTFLQLTWAENVTRHTDKPVLILTPLAVGFQTVLEGEKIGLEVNHRRDGKHSGDRLIVTNYERLHYFNANDYAGVVCDESSILKNYAGKTRKSITDFMKDIPYRLLCTATAAPNDYIELGTSSEAIGVMERKHMLSHYFTHDGSDTAQWRLKGHTRSQLFWRWVASWAWALRKPSDMGFSDDGFRLPLLQIRDHVVDVPCYDNELLFDMPAIGLDGQRKDLRRTIHQRCEMAADICNSHQDPAVVWCYLNDEGRKLEKLIDGGINVEGSDSEERKEDVLSAFTRGEVRVLITKPRIGGFGMNWQHCSRMTFFPSHSYEQYYQAVRRCWRYGQRNPVTVDIITTPGQQYVLQNLQEKANAADKMFEELTQCTRSEHHIQVKHQYKNQVVIPSWL